MLNRHPPVVRNDAGAAVHSFDAADSGGRHANRADAMRGWLTAVQGRGRCRARSQGSTPATSCELRGEGRRHDGAGRGLPDEPEGSGYECVHVAYRMEAPHCGRSKMP